MEGTGSFGAVLSRYLLAQGVDVFDVNRFDRADRRRRGKSDSLDAENAARAVLSGRARAQAKTGDGPVEIARMYKLAKDSAVKARTQAINQLKAVLIRADPQLREELAGLGNAELFRTCARLCRRQPERRGRRRGGAPRHPRHPGSPGPARQAAQRRDPGPGRPPDPAGGPPRSPVARGGGHRSGHRRHFADHDRGQPGTPGQ
ncbi:IS110 family transposase [Streptomyces naganishii]|uniref:IS110 family transposase n=1 Tax=Streptomyces naganishii TaxID=285447 RepID=UPI001E540222|nr:transposase [Streptomyces naganishii]